MRSDVALDWEWADGHMRAIANVLQQNAMHLLSVHVAPAQRDLKKATDIIVTIDGGDVAVRIRRAEYRGKYRDLTIRSWRRGGVKTELDKLKEGFCDWYLYGWSDGHGGLADWFLVDLNKLRESGLLEDAPFKSNHDSRTGFVYISDAKLRDRGCMVSELGADSPEPAQLSLESVWADAPPS